MVKFNFRESTSGMERYAGALGYGQAAKGMLHAAWGDIAASIRYPMPFA